MKTRNQIPTLSIVPFILMVFGISWGLFVLLAFYSEFVVSTFGVINASNPLFILAVYAPAITAFVIILYHAGFDGLKRYMSRLLLYRCSKGWYIFLIAGIPLIYLAGSLVKGNLFTDPFPFTTLASALSAMGFMLILGPVEEFGWRGLMLPLLQRCMAPLWSGLILGLVWGVWHLPAFFVSGTPQNAWGFAPFLLGAIAVSVIVTALFNQSRGSILLAALFHFQLNNPLFPDAQPYDTIFFLLSAILVVWIHRATMFAVASGITNVIPDS